MTENQNETLCPECSNSYHWTWAGDTETAPQTHQDCDRCGREWGDNSQQEEK